MKVTLQKSKIEGNRISYYSNRYNNRDKYDREFINERNEGKGIYYY